MNSAVSGFPYSSTMLSPERRYSNPRQFEAVSSPPGRGVRRSSGKSNTWCRSLTDPERGAMPLRERRGRRTHVRRSIAGDAAADRGRSAAPGRSRSHRREGSAAGLVLAAGDRAVCPLSPGPARRVARHTRQASGRHRRSGTCVMRNGSHQPVRRAGPVNYAIRRGFDGRPRSDKVSLFSTPEAPRARTSRSARRRS